MSLGSCPADVFGEPGVGSWGRAGTRLPCATWKLRLCRNMILGIKNAQRLPERGLAVGRFQLEGGHVTRGVSVAPGLWTMIYAPLPPQS